MAGGRLLALVVLPKREGRLVIRLPVRFGVCRRAGSGEPLGLVYVRALHHLCEIKFLVLRMQMLVSGCSLFLN